MTKRPSESQGYSRCAPAYWAETTVWRVLCTRCVLCVVCGAATAILPSPWSGGSTHQSCRSFWPRVRSQKCHVHSKTAIYIGSGLMCVTSTLLLVTSKESKVNESVGDFFELEPWRKYKLMATTISKLWQENKCKTSGSFGEQRCTWIYAGVSTAM